VEGAAAEWREENDVVARWLESCCERGDFLTASGERAYLNYKLWAEQNNEHIYSNNLFSKKLQSHGFEHKHTNKCARYTGFKLRERQALDETDDQDVPF
jgi:phage/plasmid-associated DNA primase